MLCRKLLNTLDDEECVTAYIPNSYLSPDEFRCAVASELGVYTRDKSNHDLLQTLSERLIDYAHKGKRVVLLVDEAQAMPDATIEALRLLTNLETESEKLFQVVLFGQPELDLKLNQYSLRQLKQRVTYSYKLACLDADEVQGYISQRMKTAGYQGGPVFDREACRLIALASNGVPRLVNILSHKALLVAFGKGDDRVNSEYVVRAIQDTEGVQMPASSWPKHWFPTAVAMLASAAATWALTQMGLLL